MTLEYIRCEWGEWCMDPPSYICSECKQTYCKEHIKHYDDAGKYLEEPICLKCHPLPADVHPTIDERMKKLFG